MPFLSHFQPQVPFFALASHPFVKVEGTENQNWTFFKTFIIFTFKNRIQSIKVKVPKLWNQKLLCLLRHNPSTISVSDKDISVIHHHHIQLLNASSKKWVRLVQGICWVDCGGLGWEHFTPFFIMVYSQAQ